MRTNSVPILLEFWTDQYCIKYDRKILLQKNSLSYLVGAIPIYLSRKFYQLSELLYSAVLPWVVQTMPSPNGCLLHFELLELLIVPITFHRRLFICLRSRIAKQGCPIIIPDFFSSFHDISKYSRRTF